MLAVFVSDYAPYTVLIFHIGMIVIHVAYFMLCVPGFLVWLFVTHTLSPCVICTDNDPIKQYIKIVRIMICPTCRLIHEFIFPDDMVMDDNGWGQYQGNTWIAVYCTSSCDGYGMSWGMDHGREQLKGNNILLLFKMLFFEFRNHLHSTSVVLAHVQSYHVFQKENDQNCVARKTLIQTDF